MPASVPVIRLIQRLAEEVGAQTVAEGIEDLAALKTISDIGCCRIQGNYFSAPVAIEAFQSAVDRIETQIAADCRGV